MRPAATLRGLILTIGVIACSAPLACGKAAQRAGIPVDETQRLRQENESLAKQYELAAGNAFYLLVDPSAGQLTLAFRGAALRRYSLLDAQVGVPRIAFIIWGVRRDPAGIIWSGGRLDPEPPSDRVELKVSSSGSGGEPPSPPLPPEVAAPVPATYVLLTSRVWSSRSNEPATIRVPDGDACWPAGGLAAAARSPRSRPPSGA